MNLNTSNNLNTEKNQLTLFAGLFSVFLIFYLIGLLDLPKNYSNLIFQARVFLSLSLIFLYLLTYRKLNLPKILFYIIPFSIYQFVFGFNKLYLDFNFLLILSVFFFNLREFEKRIVLLFIAYCYLFITSFIYFLDYFGLYQFKLVYFAGNIYSTLGFINQNGFSLIVFISMLIFWLLNKKFSLIISIGLLILSFKQTDTRTTLYLMIILIISTFIIYILRFFKLNSISFIYNITAFTIIYGIGIYLVVFADSLINKYSFLDSILSKRLYFAIMELSKIKFINYIFGGQEVIIDSMYLNLIAQFGFIFMFALYVVFVLTIYKLSIMKKDKYVLLILTFFSFGIFEGLISTSSIFSILVFSFIFEAFPKGINFKI